MTENNSVRTDQAASTEGAPESTPETPVLTKAQKRHQQGMQNLQVGLPIIAAIVASQLLSRATDLSFWGRMGVTVLVGAAAGVIITLIIEGVKKIRAGKTSGTAGS